MLLYTFLRIKYKNRDYAARSLVDVKQSFAFTKNNCCVKTFMNMTMFSMCSSFHCRYFYLLYIFFFLLFFTAILFLHSFLAWEIYISKFTFLVKSRHFFIFYNSYIYIYKCIFLCVTKSWQLPVKPMAFPTCKALTKKSFCKWRIWIISLFLKKTKKKTFLNSDIDLCNQSFYSKGWWERQQKFIIHFLHTKIFFYYLYLPVLQLVPHHELKSLFESNSVLKVAWNK